MKEPWEMTLLEFEKAIRKGKVYEGTSKVTPGEKEAKTFLARGEANGYPAIDIAYFYYHCLICDALVESRRRYLRDAVFEGKSVPREILEEYESEKWAQEALAKLERKKNDERKPDNE